MGWPKGVPRHRQLTDADLAVIAAADPSIPTVAIASELGKPYFTVAHARQKMARLGGWCCPVALGVCTECGGPLLTSPDRPRTTHPACLPARAARYSRVRRQEGKAATSTPYVAAWRQREPVRSRALREQDKARLRARWPELPAEEQAEMLARLHAADARDYPVTAEVAQHSGARWEPAEDRYILEHPQVPAREVALVLGRTLWAVRGRRVRLRHQQDGTAAP
jgi:hypothetical protein